MSLLSLPEPSRTPPAPPTPSSESSGRPALLRGLTLAQKRELIQGIYQQYREASRDLRGQLLSDLCTKFGYHRKHAIRLMRTTRDLRLGSGRSRRQPSEPLIRALAEIHELSGFLGARKLRQVLPQWISSYSASHPELTKEDQERLSSMSHATITRILSKIGRSADETIARLAFSRLERFADAGIRSLKPSTPGCVFVREVALSDSQRTQIRRALCAMDALSGWVAVVPFEGSIITALEKLSARLPFPLHSLILQTRSGAEGFQARTWAWQREEPIPFFFTKIEECDEIPLGLASRDVERVLNFGRLTLSPHRDGRTPWQVLEEQRATSVPSAAYSEEEHKKLYASGKSTLQALREALQRRS